MNAKYVQIVLWLVSFNRPLLVYTWTLKLDRTDWVITSQNTQHSLSVYKLAHCNHYSRFMNWKLIKTKLKHLGIWHNLKLTYHTPATWGDTSIKASRDESRSIERELRRLWSADIVFSAFQISIWRFDFLDFADFVFCFLMDRFGCSVSCVAVFPSARRRDGRPIKSTRCIPVIEVEWPGPPSPRPYGPNRARISKISWRRRAAE